MPAKTTQKGEIGEAMIIADLIRQGHDVAIPFGHNQPFDLIVIRKENGRLERVQVKYATSDGRASSRASRAARPGSVTSTRSMRSIGSRYTSRRLLNASICRLMCGVTGVESI